MISFNNDDIFSQIYFENNPLYQVYYADYKGIYKVWELTKTIELIAPLELNTGDMAECILVINGRQYTDISIICNTNGEYVNIWDNKFNVTQEGTYTISYSKRGNLLTQDIKIENIEQTLT